MTRSFFILALGLGSAVAQVYTPPTNRGQQNNNGVPQAPPSYQGQNNNSGSQGGSLYGNEIPFMDPNQETISVAGRSFPIADTRLLSARYEKYLNEPADDSEPSRKYRSLIKQVVKTVSPLDPDTPVNKLRKALRMLPEAAEYVGDAEQANALCNAIHTAYMSKASIRDKKEAIKELEIEQKRTVRNMSVIEKHRDLTTETGKAIKAEGNKNPKRSETARQNNIVYDQMNKRLIEIDVLKKKYEGEGALSAVQSKLFYQAQMVHFTLQRRFEHAKIGCSVYNIIFDDGDSKLKLSKDSDAAKVFGETVGMPPTVATLETLSNEAIRDTIRAVDSVKQLIKNKRLTSANKRLAEAYYVGEFLEPIRTFPTEDKLMLFDYMQDMRQLKSAMEGRDFGRAKQLVESLRERSLDFDASIVTPLIEMAIQASNLRIMNAQQAMLNKDTAKAQEEIKEALNIWPMNPMMKDMQDTLIQSSGVIVAKNDFERLLHEENYRQIFREQYRFAPVVAGDPVLEDAFEQIIRNIGAIEVSIQKAKEAVRLGNPYGAWEELKFMQDQKTFSKDPELWNEIVRVTPQASEMAQALDRAISMENKGEIGSALYWYMKMRGIYPASRYADEGIDRLKKKIFESSSESGSQELPPV